VLGGTYCQSQRCFLLVELVATPREAVQVVVATFAPVQKEDIEHIMDSAQGRAVAVAVAERQAHRIVLGGAQMAGRAAAAADRMQETTVQVENIALLMGVANSWT